MKYLYLISLIFVSCQSLKVSENDDSGSGIETVGFSGKLYNSQKSPLSNSQVHLYKSDKNSITQIDSTRTDKNGSYHFKQVPLGTYQIIAKKFQDEDTISVYIKDILVISNNLYLENTLTQPGKIAGIINYNKKAKSVSLKTTPYAATIQNNGEFSITNVPTGKYNLCIQESLSNNECLYTQPIEVFSGKSTHISISQNSSSILQAHNKSRYKNIFINTTSSGLNLQENLYNYPILIRLRNYHIENSFFLSNPDFLQIYDNRYQELSFEVSHWDSDKKEVDIWIRLNEFKKMDFSQFISLHWEQEQPVKKALNQNVFSNSMLFSGSWFFDNSQVHKDYVTNSTYSIDVGSVLKHKNSISGHSISLENQTSHIQIPNREEFNFTDAFNISLWVSTKSFKSTHEMIVSKGVYQWELMRSGINGDRSGNGHSFALHIDTASHLDNKSFPGGGIDTIISANTKIDDGKWHLLTAQYDGKFISVYIDGILENFIPFTGTFYSSDEPIWVGANYNHSSKRFSGLIDEFRISNTSRSNEWILMDYKTQRPEANWIPTN